MTINITTFDIPLHPAPPEVVIDTLADARAILAKGWTRGVYKRSGRFCLVGAIDTAADQRDPGQRAGLSYQCELALKSTLRPSISNLAADGYVSIVDFNDRQKTKLPVLALIDATIDRLSAEASA